MCQRLEVPRKTTVCHLKCFTLWVEGFKEEYFRHKHHHTCRPCDSQWFCLPGSVESIFCWEHPTLLPPQLFSRSMTVERLCWFNSQKKAFLSFPGSTPRRQNSQGSWGQHCQHTCHRAAPQASLPPQRKGGEAPSAIYLSAYTQQTTSYKLIQSLEVQHDHWEDTVNYPLIKLQLDIQHLEWGGFLSKIWRGKGKFWLWVSNPSPATWPWPNLLTFRSLCFLVFKMGTGIIPTPPG